MRSVQEILNAVIDSGVYRSKFHMYNGSEYMCIALRYAVDRETITKDEQNLVAGEIRKRIRPCPTLETYLLVRDAPREFEDRLCYYKNWSNDRGENENH